MRFPELEAKPPVRAITDPANEESSTPAVSAAAKVKAEEDKADQKIKGIRYLATVGCTNCYPDVDDALLAALDDCTEEVRYEAVRAIRKAACSCCESCKSNNCCTPEILKRLRQMACETDEECLAFAASADPCADCAAQTTVCENCGSPSGRSVNYGCRRCCHKEPSARIRRLARVVLETCGPVPEAVEAGPTEGPSRAPREDSDEETPNENETPNEDEAELESTTVHLDQSDGGAPDLSIITDICPRPDAVLATVNGQAVCGCDVVPDARHRFQEMAGGHDALFQRSLFQTLLRDEVNRKIDRILWQSNQLPPAGAAVPFGPHRNASGFVAAESIPVTQDDIAAYYRANYQQFQLPEAVRWECVTVPRTQVGSQDKAIRWLSYIKVRATRTDTDRPRDFDADAIVVKTFDWTTRDQVTSPEVSESLFRLVPTRLSSVIQDETGWHLLRVLEHRPPSRAPLSQVADKIRGEIIHKRSVEQQRERVSQFRRNADVWTVYDMPPQHRFASPGLRRLPRIDIVENEESTARRLPTVDESGTLGTL